MRRFASNAGIMVVASWSTIAMAQVPPDSQMAAGTQSQIAEIVVTAQRRSENLQRVPIAVTAISAAQLQANGIQSTANLANITPSLTFANANGFLAPRVRGIGNSAAGPGVENSTATYVDGVYLGSAPATLLSLGNIARVEVLKGPQGTLFGRNATGGLIQVITADPSSERKGNFDIGLDNYEMVRANGYVTGPISDAIAADLAFSIGHQGEGYGKNVTTGNDIYRTERDIAIRSKILAHLGEDTTAHLAADYENNLTSDPAFAPVTGSKPVFAASKYFPADPWDTATNIDPFHKTEAGGVSLRLDHNFGGATLSSISAYRKMRFDTRFDGDISPAPVVDTIYTQKDQQLSQELQLASSGEGPFKWMFGLFYYELKARYDPYTLLQGVPPAQTASIRHQNSWTQSLAGYGQFSYEFLPDTTVTAGLRYTRDERSLKGTVRTVPPSGIATVVPNDDDTSYKVPTWRLALDHRFSEKVMAYLSYNRGFKSGGYNAQSPTAPPYAPEKLDAYEAGFKAILFDSRLRLNAAAFFYKYRNIQVNTFIGTVGVVYNGASAETYGVDADFELALSNRLRLNGGIVALHDRFTSFKDAVLGTINPDGSATLGRGPATGNRLPFAPDVTVNLGLDYTIPLSDGSFKIAVNELYSSGFYTQPDNVLKQPDYHMLGGSLTWKSDNGLWVRAWGNNLLNKEVVVSDVITTVAQIKSLQAPRTFGLTIGATF